MSSAAVCYNMVLAATAMGFDAQWQTDWVAYDPEAMAAMGLKGERTGGRHHLHWNDDRAARRPATARSAGASHAVGEGMTIRGVLFDKDGTLIDVNGTWVPIYRQMLCEQFDIKPAEADRMMAGVGYNASTDAFNANSMLAAGTTRQLIEFWWPGLG